MLITRCQIIKIMKYFGLISLGSFFWNGNTQCQEGFVYKEIRLNIYLNINGGDSYEWF